jgi:hypothetical protein
VITQAMASHCRPAKRSLKSKKPMVAATAGSRLISTPKFLVDMLFIAMISNE